MQLNLKLLKHIIDYRKWNNQNRSKLHALSNKKKKLFVSSFYSSSLHATLAEGEDRCCTRSSRLSTYGIRARLKCMGVNLRHQNSGGAFRNSQIHNPPPRCQAVNYFCSDRLLCFYFWYFGCAQSQSRKRLWGNLAHSHQGGALYWKAINARWPRRHKYVRAPFQQLKGSLYHLQHS